MLTLHCTFCSPHAMKESGNEIAPPTDWWFARKKTRWGCPLFDSLAALLRWEQKRDRWIENEEGERKSQWESLPQKYRVRFCPGGMNVALRQWPVFRALSSLRESLFALAKSERGKKVEYRAVRARSSLRTSTVHTARVVVGGERWEKWLFLGYTPKHRRRYDVVARYRETRPRLLFRAQRICVTHCKLFPLRGSSPIELSLSYRSIVQATVVPPATNV